MIEIKLFFFLKIFWGLVIVVGGVIVGFFGLDFINVDQVEFIGFVDQVFGVWDIFVVIVGGLFVIYGWIIVIKIIG